MTGYINVELAIAEAKEAMEARAKSLHRVDVVRADLRNAVEFGDCTAEERAWINETFPVKVRKTLAMRAVDAATVAKQLADRVAAEKADAAKGKA